MVFRHFDRDRSGSIDGDELSQALGSFGYKLSPTILTLIEHKYGVYSLPLVLGYSVMSIPQHLGHQPDMGRRLE